MYGRIYKTIPYKEYSAIGYKPELERYRIVWDCRYPGMVVFISRDFYAIN